MTLTKMNIIATALKRSLIKKDISDYTTPDDKINISAMMKDITDIDLYNLCIGFYGTHAVKKTELNKDIVEFFTELSFIESEDNPKIPAKKSKDNHFTGLWKTINTLILNLAIIGFGTFEFTPEQASFYISEYNKEMEKANGR